MFDFRSQEEAVKKYFAVLFVLAIAGVLFGAAQDFSGTWTSSVQGYPHVMVLRVNGSALTGTADGLTISRGYVDASSVQFMVVRNGATLTYKGVIGGGLLLLQEDQASSNSHRALVYTRTGN
jgi:hypothetical protein